VTPARDAAPSRSPVAHPTIVLTKPEALAIKNALGKYPLLDHSYNETKAMVDHALANPTDVPQPGEAGGYAHERHKQNYREMQAAGLLYQITGEVKYAQFVRDMLEKYALLYPTLGPHPLAMNQAPGKLFHQSLNEANWLVAVDIAYDCVYDFLKPAHRNECAAADGGLAVGQSGQRIRPHPQSRHLGNRIGWYARSRHRRHQLCEPRIVRHEARQERWLPPSAR
jgi:hypothetical protein